MNRRFASAASLWRIRYYLRPYYGQMLWMLLATALATGASIVIPLIVRNVVDGPIARGEQGGIFKLGLLALGLGIVEAILIFIRRWVQSSTALGMEAELRSDLYRHLQKLPIAFHDRWQSGQLLSRATSDLGVIRRFLSFGLIFGIINTATYLTVVYLLIQLYWPLGVLVAVTAIPLFLVSRAFTIKYIKMSRALQDQQGDLATLIEESATGVRVVKSFGRQPHMASMFSRGATQLHDTAVGKARMVANTLSQFDLVPNITLAVVLVGGAAAVANDQLTVGELIAFVSLQTLLVWPIDALGWIIANGQEAMTAADRVYEVFDTAPAIVDRPDAVEVSPSQVRGRLRFEGVEFAYPDARAPVLHRIDLDLAPGETVAIVGATGSGKTALGALVPRLYDVTGGRITIDGRDVRDFTLNSLRAIVAVAFEEATLFSMSVRENLTLGRQDATDEQIDEALRTAQAEFVYQLPYGLNTRIGEQGLSLSGGQRQRLALARAVISRPKVLVLDDPLSALDVHTEALVEQALARTLVGTTALLVVHRPSTVALADRVALLQDGVIAAIGTHSELMATVPAYRAALSAEADATV